MIEVHKAEVECPYCGFIKTVYPNLYPVWTTVYCESDEGWGGCRKLFIFKPIVTVTFETKKVAGEEM